MKTYSPTRKEATMDANQYTQALKAIREHSGMDLSQIREAGEHGADAGWPGFTYTADGADFSQANIDLIYDVLADTANNFGYQTVAELVATFNRADMADTHDGYLCLLSWFMLEETGQMLADRMYEKQHS